jgi:uncharacterized protein (DUF2384 family)
VTPAPTDLQRLAAEVLGSSELTRAWFATPSPFLDGRTPQSVLGSDEGHERVRALLLRIEHGLLA